jgi:hypothetical protein
MSYGNIRRAQLVAPFGVGAMTVLANGTGVLSAGLDHWFERADGNTDAIDEEEFRVEEWRLQAALGVEGFRTPPDWRRETFGSSDAIDNLGLAVPLLRFPTWHFCRYCKRLAQLTLDYREFPRCQGCGKNGKKGPVIAQVPFVAVCDYGHLQDFPFVEWVHQNPKPGCRGPLTLTGTGAASLAAQVVECLSCKKTRTLSRITEGRPESEARPASSYLSENLADDDFGCPGVSAWHGTLDGSPCGQPLRGSLRAAANVYYALVRSAIFLPREQDVDPQLLEILSKAPLGPTLRLLSDLGLSGDTLVDGLRKHQAGKNLLLPYEPKDLAHAIEVLQKEDGTKIPTSFSDEWDEAAFRAPEYRALSKAQESPELKIRADQGSYSGVVGTHLDGMRLVERLRETRALYGFNRINADGKNGLTDRKQLLRARSSSKDWLPAYVVNGEGLLIGFEPDRLAAWEQRPDVVARVEHLADLYEVARQQRSLRERSVTGRFVLVHTFAHLLMNRLTFDCGYSSASLRERLFVAEDMAAVLIYTAAGDSEGTMGGLVRMGKPGILEPVIEQALRESAWCSSDPICMECGDQGGQGPDSCNLAACHSCALVPETACEEFNRFLDRGLVTGTLLDPALGYFPSAVVP